MRKASAGNGSNLEKKNDKRPNGIIYGVGARASRRNQHLEKAKLTVGLSKIIKDRW